MSNEIAADIGRFELARVMGPSPEVIAGVYPTS
jgi:hypothetical protein